jgi:hypothetical protein
MKENGRKRNIDKFPMMATTIHGISGSTHFFFPSSGRMPTWSTIPVYYVVPLVSVARSDWLVILSIQTTELFMVSSSAGLVIAEILRLNLITDIEQRYLL